MVDKGPEISRSHKMDAVQIRNVDNALVWWRVLLVVLVNVQGEKDDVDSIQMLEHDETLATKWKLFRVVFVRVAFLHQVAHFELPVH